MGSFTPNLNLYKPAFDERAYDDEFAASMDNLDIVGGSVINVMAAPYNAVGNGSTNDTVAFATAIAAADPGVAVFVPGGHTYRVSNLSVSGASGVALIGGPGAVIKGPGGANPVIATFTDCEDLAIRGLQFDANGATTFGGVRFYDCARPKVIGNRYFDSSPQAASGSDIYSFVFTKNTSNNTDVQIVGNVIEDLQVEVDHCSGAFIAHNRVYRAKQTSGIGVFSTATGTPLCEDYHIHDNLIVDPNASAGGIAVVIDPVATNNCTFRRFDIHDNTVVYTGSSTPKTGIRLGTTNNSVATTGNVFTDIRVHHNSVTYLGGTFTGEAISFNSSVTSAFSFVRCFVGGNVLLGRAAGIGVDLRIFTDSIAVDNLAKNFATTLNHPSDSNSYVDDVDASGQRHYGSLYVDTAVLLGSAGDVNLYRSAANKLKTDDLLIVTGDGGTPGALQVGGYAGSSASSTGLGVFGNSEFSNDVVLGGNLRASSGSYIEATELTGDPSAPAANKVRFYAKDVGGKTALFARFPTGAVQQIAIEP